MKVKMIEIRFEVLNCNYFNMNFKIINVRKLL